MLRKEFWFGPSTIYIFYRNMTKRELANSVTIIIISGGY